MSIMPIGHLLNYLAFDLLNRTVNPNPIAAKENKKAVSGIVPEPVFGFVEVVSVPVDTVGTVVSVGRVVAVVTVVLLDVVVAVVV